MVEEALLNVAVLVAVILPATRDDPVALSKNSEERYAVVARSMEEKRLVEVAVFKVAEFKLKLVILAFSAVRLVSVAEPEAIVMLEMVVVAREACPCTLKVPVLVVEAKTLLEDMRLLIVA